VNFFLAKGEFVGLGLQVALDLRLNFAHLAVKVNVQRNFPG